jgi:hypothetical protein
MLRIHRPFLSCFVALALVALTSSSLTFAGTRPGKIPSTGVQKDKDKDKKDKSEDKQSKQEREYLKMKRFSEQEYQKDPAFRDEVEEAYRHKQREHSEYAFYFNTRDAKDEQITRTGDHLKIQDTLYDNPMVQDYVNRLGQSLVPSSSPHLFAFKVTLNPIPEARSLSTGTIYVSSGLISIADNEAQLAYVLSHEIAHIEKDHWHQDVLIGQGIERYNEKQETKRKVAGGVISVLGGPLMRAMGADPFTSYAVASFASSPTLLKLVVPNSVATWDKAQEDEADQLALQYMLNRNYDPREVPKFYAGLYQASTRDRRAGLGYMADAGRIVDRVQKIDEAVGGLGTLMSKEGLMVGAISLGQRDRMNADLVALRRAVDADIAASLPPPAKPADPGKQLDPGRDAAGRMKRAEEAVTGKLAADINAKLANGELIGTVPEFQAIMTELRRDNGIRAYYYDMFQMSRDNLEESLRIRNNDPYAHHYYGKVLRLTARTPDEKSRALGEFAKAIELDRRNVLPEPHLYRALSMIDARDTGRTREIVTSLQEYVAIYQREHAGALPSNMEVIYDYMQEAQELTWAARPVMNVSSKNVEVMAPTSSPHAVDTGPGNNNPPVQPRPRTVKKP